MSKIMRELYAQARVAREAAAPACGPATGNTPAGPSTLDSSRLSGIEWWRMQYERGGRAHVSKIADAAIHAIELPCTPAEHARWWQERMDAAVGLK
jgi:hypothetical protein